MNIAIAQSNPIIKSLKNNELQLNALEKLQQKSKHLSRQYQQSPNKNSLSQTMNCYYVKGNVFERDQKYYLQPIASERSKNRNISQVIKSKVIKIDNQRNIQSQLSCRIMPKQRNNKQLKHQTNCYQPAQNSSYNSNIHQAEVANKQKQNDINQQQQIQLTAQSKQELKLKQENRQLIQQLTNLSKFQQSNNNNIIGNQGNHLNISKKSYYLQQPSQNKKIKQQQQIITTLIQQRQKNNTKIQKYRRGVNFMNIKVNNLRLVQQEIYTSMKRVGARERKILEQVKRMLYREEPQQKIIKKLSQIMLS